MLLGPLVVPREAAETARNIVAHPTQFRIAVTGFLFYSLNSIVLLAAVYVVFKPINQGACSPRIVVSARLCNALASQLFESVKRAASR